MVIRHITSSGLRERREGASVCDGNLGDSRTGQKLERGGEVCAQGRNLYALRLGWRSES